VNKEFAIDDPILVSLAKSCIDAHEPFQILVAPERAHALKQSIENWNRANLARGLAARWGWICFTILSFRLRQYWMVFSLASAEGFRHRIVDEGQRVISLFEPAQQGRPGD